MWRVPVHPSAGLCSSEAGEIETDPDVHVRDAIRTVFAKFGELCIQRICARSVKHYVVGVSAEEHWVHATIRKDNSTAVTVYKGRARVIMRRRH